METWDILRNIWFVLIGILFAGYSILDGFDLGIGTLFPFLAKNKKEKDLLLKSIGPFWDGNEVWLLTGGGALFAAFPHVYATVFSGFYLALMLVLFALIFRAVSLEFRSHDPKRKTFWESTFILGSLLPSLLFGVALGNVIKGIPLDNNMDYMGNFFTLLNPFSLAIGLLGLTTILLHGSTYAVMKLDGDIQFRGRKLAKKFLIVFIGLFLISIILSSLYLPGSMKKIIPWIISSAVILLVFLLYQSLIRSRDKSSFILTCLIFCCLWGIVGAAHFPNLVRASNNTALSLTISNSSSSQLTLTVMLIIALIGMPLVIGYTIFLYKVFKGKVSSKDSSY